MHLLIVHHYALPPGAAGGTRHFTLARLLVARGHDVTIIASRHAYSGKGTVSDAAEDVIDGVRFVWSDQGARESGLAGRGAGMVKFARDAIRLGRRLSADGAQFDVVMGTSPQPFAAFAAGRLARKLGRPFLLEIRDLWPMSVRDLTGWGDWHPVWIALRQLEKRLYRSADRIVTLLPGSERWIEGDAPRARIDVVPNGVDVARAPEPAPLPEGEVFTCVYAGAHGVANGLDTLVRAAALLPTLPGGAAVRIRLIGDGPTKPALRAQAEELGAAALEFRDPVPKSQIDAELARADATILHLRRMPTFDYGVSPNKLFDYLLAGRPVVYAVEAANDPVAEADAGLSIGSEDPEALARALISLAQRSRGDREAMAQRGVAWVKAHHDWQVLAGRFERILGQMVS